MKNKRKNRKAGSAILAAWLGLGLLGGCSSSGSAADAAKSQSQETCSADSAACDDYAVTEAKGYTEDFEPMTFDDAIAFFQDGKSGVIYFGFPACPWCEELLPILSEEAKSQGIAVHYVQTRDDEKKRLYDDEQKAAIEPYIGSAMKDNDEGELTLYVPLVVVVKDGKMADFHQGTVEGHDAHERKMTEEEKKELEQTIHDLLAETDSSKASE